MKGAILAAVAGLAARASAMGSTTIINQCSQDLYFAQVESGGKETISPLPATQSQEWSLTSAGGGWVFKIGTESDLNCDILQYEFTLVEDMNLIFYDMSLVNVDANNADLMVPPGNQTTWLPIKVAPIEWAFSSSSEGCSPLNSHWYNYPDSPSSTQSCNPEDDITLTLCPSGSPAEYFSVSSVGSNSVQTASPSSYSAAASSTSTAAASYSSASSAAASSVSAAVASAYTSQASSSASQTTFATSASSASGGYFTGIAKQANVQGHESTTAVTSASVSLTTSVAANGKVVTSTAIDTVIEINTVFVTARDAEPTPAVHRRHTHGHPHGGHRA